MDRTAVERPSTKRKPVATAVGNSPNIPGLFRIRSESNTLQGLRSLKLSQDCLVSVTEKRREFARWTVLDFGNRSVDTVTVLASLVQSNKAYPESRLAAPQTVCRRQWLALDKSCRSFTHYIIMMTSNSTWVSDLSIIFDHERCLVWLRHVGINSERS